MSFFGASGDTLGPLETLWPQRTTQTGTRQGDDSAPVIHGKMSKHEDNLVPFSRFGSQALEPRYSFEKYLSEDAGSTRDLSHQKLSRMGIIKRACLLFSDSFGQAFL